MIFNRKILLAGLCCIMLILGFISPAVAAGEAADAANLTDDDKAIMAYLAETESGDWQSATISDTEIAYEPGIEMCLVNEMPLYILKSGLSGGGLPSRETTITSGKNKIAAGDFLRQVAGGEITKVKSITYSRNVNDGMMVAMEIELL